MAGYVKQTSSAGKAARTILCGLKINTSPLDTAQPDAKSPAMASTDWRRRAAAVSAPETSAKKPLQRSKESCDGSYDQPSQFRLRLDKSFSGLDQYRHTKKRQAPWEAALSAPAWPMSPSSPSVSADERHNVINIRLWSVNPITTSVNGEDIAIPNRFALDIVPVHPDAPGFVVGELRPLNGSVTSFRTSSEDSEKLLAELRGLVGCPQCGCALANPTSNEQHGFSPPARPRDVTDATISSAFGSSQSDTETHSRQERMEPPNDEERRFQTLLKRLQQPPSTRRIGGMASNSRPFVDPAIVAMKVKETAGNRQSNEATNNCEALHLDNRGGELQPQSADSGYASNSSGNSSSDRSAALGASPLNGPISTPKEPLAGSDRVKTLNPTAAEFKSTRQDDVVRCLSPKKFSRPPLTNIFPNVIPSHPPLAQPVVHESALPLLSPAGGGSTVPGHGSLGGVENWPTIGSAVFAESLRYVRPGAMNGIVPNGLASISTPPQHIIAPAQLGVASMNGPALEANLPLTSVFHTFPPAPASSLPAYAHTQAAGLHSFLPGTVPLGRLPQQQAGHVVNGKPSRPYFPVTTKPRDHDPVKQQLYEAYLEWRKANEPGYHLKCKMRQAQRVMRQYQLQQDKSASREPAGWKAVKEQAKAAVGAAAAAAAAEKRRQQESVREELRVKVKELSQNSKKGSGEGKQ
ncbi:uncharacterized protein THITE_2083831 [Thermothielavioides terrestris NRRL 8126]|uniref:Uncharacterized protein n=1 Tax=Thermothielavioides terrestris (strain ATCC 38088 / NRRL 8126) TaxID=578455 RepID=G2QX80_THETT|nr:uncharacterized protein THITE_2083831 [Thermothielavioides terrestris NRRL 8126]AEO62301.1 hypothetical protein THITE_2083831 [Thermothielavioides terrestris NRRL 8126]